jgi:hypothetical protein
VRSLLVPLLVLTAGCKTFGASDPAETEPDAAVETPDAGSPCPNGALQFDGKAYVKVENDPSFDSTADLTVEAWILPDKTIDSSEVHVVSHHDPKNSDGWVLLLDRGVTFRIYSGSGEGSTAARTLEEVKDPNLTLGEWHHIAAVFDAVQRTITIFIDGKSMGRNAGSKTKADPYSGPLTIGAAAFLPGNGFIGIIDEVRVSRKIRYPDDTPFKPAYPLPDAEEGTIGTWHFSNAAPTEVTKDAAGRFTSALATFAAPTPSYPTFIVPACPTGARP